MKELSIVEAKVVVAVGSKAFNALKGRIGQQLILVPHYAYRFIPADELRRKMDDALDRVDEARAALRAKKEATPDG